MGGNIPGRNFLGENFPEGILQWGIWWVGIFQGEIWWVGIFRVGVFQGEFSWYQRIPIYLTKNCTQDNVKCHIQHEDNIVIEQVNYKYIYWKKLCSDTFKASSEEVIVMYSAKMKADYMKEDVWKSFFGNLQVGILQLHYRLTSSQIIFRDFK